MVALQGCGNSANLKDSVRDLVDNDDSTHIKYPRIEFDTALYDFGRILQGEQISTVFSFTNTGDAELVIQKVQTSCGCTVPQYEKAPVAPGERGEIRVRFDSDGKEGTQYKTIKVSTNCEEPIFDLVIRGEVEVR